jgi:hypothetical protein
MTFSLSLLDSYYDSDRIVFVNNVEGFDPRDHDFTQIVAYRKDLALSPAE